MCSSELLHATCRSDYDPHSLEIPAVHFNMPMDKPQSLHRKSKIISKCPDANLRFLLANRTGRVSFMTYPKRLNVDAGGHSGAQYLYSLLEAPSPYINFFWCAHSLETSSSEKLGSQFQREAVSSTPIAQVLYQFHGGLISFAAFRCLVFFVWWGFRNVARGRMNIGKTRIPKTRLIYTNTYMYILYMIVIYNICLNYNYTLINNFFQSKALWESLKILSGFFDLSQF